VGISARRFDALGDMNETDLLRICADDGACRLLWPKPTNRAGYVGAET
jgi:hypothetical protein